MELRIIPIVRGRRGVLVSLTLLLGTLVSALDDPILSPVLFYPFGPDVGDSVMTPNDDGSSGSVTIDVGFPFFAKSNTELFVNTNGAISFGQPVQTFTPQSFPVALRMIAPYWCDIDTRQNDGRIYYRQSTDEKLLNRATQDVLQSFASRGLHSFEAKWIFIATWHNVTYYGGGTRTPVNSFQAVLITDGKHSMAMFNYGRISWTTGVSSGGNAATGLGGTAAQVGFNAGDSVNFFAVPGSRESSIVDIAGKSNVGLTGRWLFQIDSATIEGSSSSCETTGKCRAHQIYDEKSGRCSDVAPAFKCPTLEGPEVIDRRWIEFYCSIPINETSVDAAFNVTFLFNGEPSDQIPSFIVRSPEQRATLHEKHLSQKLLGKWISCRVFSFWSNTTNATNSQTLTSTNSYWAGIEVSSHTISVYEGDPYPATLTLKSTLPITCHREGLDSCDLILRLASTKDILIRGKDKRACSLTLTEADWKPEERKAYRDDERLQIFAKIDLIVSGPRFNSLTFDISELPDKFTADGERYVSMWSKYSLPEITVYHHDVPQAVCRATGDPNLTTFDRFFYSVYASGQFTYVQTTSGTPIEVQVRHKPCGVTVSCVCGVAVREADLILVADKCTDDILRKVTFSDVENLPRGVGIFQNENGRSFEMVLPSKVRVVAYLSSWRMNIEIFATSREFRRTEGLCGLFDGNGSNDLRVKETHQTQGKPSLTEIVESWRLPAGSSLFDGVPSKLNKGQTASFPANDDSQTFCDCQGLATECGLSIVDNSLLEGDTNRFRRNSVKQAGRYMNNTFQPSKSTRNPAFNSSLSRTDDIDWEYDGLAFFYNDPKYAHRPGNLSWPTWNGITEETARAHCQRVLWNESPLRVVCENLVSMSEVGGVINKCVSDIKMTGDLSWADDKISEIQNLCIFEAVTVNIIESNSTIDQIAALVQDITAVVCLPQDCSGHGTCRNGTCICDKGYLGSDCALSEDTIPKIIRILGPTSCDLDRFPCQKIEFVTENVTSLPTLVCRVDFAKSDYSTQSFKTSASVETMETTSCKLPTDLLQGSLRLLRANSTPTPIPPDAEPIDFNSLTLGSPVLHYFISISNNGRSFSNPHPATVYDSRCYSCDGQSCSRKNDSCLINGYCFANSDSNPFNPECDRCEPTVSSSSWTKLPDPSCDPCRSSPCVNGSTCVSKFKGKYSCIDETHGRTLLILETSLIILVVTVIVVIVTIFAIRYRRRREYKSPSGGYEELQPSGRSTEDMTRKLTGSNF